MVGAPCCVLAINSMYVITEMQTFGLYILNTIFYNQRHKLITWIRAALRNAALILLLPPTYSQILLGKTGKVLNFV